MILMKVKIKRTEKEGSTHLEYPKPYWDSQKILFGPVYEPVERGQGRNWEYCVIGVAETDAPNFLRGNNKKCEQGKHTFSVQQIDVDEATSMCEPWHPIVELMGDRDAVIKALARQARGTMTAEDDKILDPDDDTPGINKSKSFGVKIREAMERNPN